MATIEEQLLVEEYKSCRELILKNIDIIEKTAIYAIGACAAIGVYSLQASDRVVADITILLAPIVAILGWLHFAAMDEIISKINGHLMETEEKHPALNWTHYYRANNRPKKLKNLRHAFWLTLLAASIIGAAYVNFRCQ
jgi:hypothetical protein